MNVNISNPYSLLCIPTRPVSYSCSTRIRKKLKKNLFQFLKKVHILPGYILSYWIGYSLDFPTQDTRVSRVETGTQSLRRKKFAIAEMNLVV